jgi:phage repressor protein C with HTH and peptisase S24 domain
MAKTPKAPLTHDQIWTALDRLAQRAGLSPSGLAKRSGLDPTTFNKSKRITPDGRERWPSTESVAKALAATNSSIDTFVQLIGDTARTVQSVPLLGFTQASAVGYFDDAGFPAGKGWDEVGLPSVNDEHAYALEISGDQLRPAYRDGDVIVVSPGTPIRRGDRVVVKTAQSEPCRPHSGGQRSRVDRADRVGESVSSAIIAGLDPAIHQSRSAVGRAKQRVARMRAR